MRKFSPEQRKRGHHYGEWQPPNRAASMGGLGTGMLDSTA